MAVDYDGCLEIRWGSARFPGKRFRRASRSMVSHLRTAATPKSSIFLAFRSNRDSLRIRWQRGGIFLWGNHKEGPRRLPQSPATDAGSACPHPGAGSCVGNRTDCDAAVTYCHCPGLWPRGYHVVCSNTARPCGVTTPSMLRGCCLPVAQTLSGGSSCGCPDFKEAPDRSGARWCQSRCAAHRGRCTARDLPVIETTRA
jgi:hypothetical protein